MNADTQGIVHLLEKGEEMGVSVGSWPAFG